MTEREMLEWAAKAAGLKHMRWAGPNGLSQMLDPTRPESTGSIGGYWNPLTDDGDCARLEAACGINVAWCEIHVVASNSRAHPCDWLIGKEDFADHGGDRQKARRWVSTKAAATLGKSAAMDGEG
jgi:hypothetical protein